MESSILEFDRELARFLKMAIAKYGYAVVNQWQEEHGQHGLIDLYSKYRYNLFELFAKHQRHPIEVGMQIFLDKRSTDEQHRIEQLPEKEIWVYSDADRTIRIHVTPSNYGRYYQVIKVESRSH